MPAGKGKMILRRIAFITESSTRQSEPMEAYQFYQGQRSRWVNSIISYMQERDFPREDMFFLSHYEQRIIGFNEIVEPYPVQKHHPRRVACRMFAEKILSFVLSMNPVPFVEIHAGRTIADPLMELFQKYDIQFRLFGDGVPLGAKSAAYESLIEEERNQRKLKEISREKRHVSAIVRHSTPQEASRIVSQYENRAQLYGIEENIKELKNLLGAYNQRRKHEKKAMAEFEAVMKEEDPSGRLESFLLSLNSLSDLLGNPQFESYKSAFGKSVAKFICYLFKRQFVASMENKISESLLRTQIALLK